MAVEPPGTAFASFVRGRSAALLRTAYLLTGDQHLAEDLVQSALARTHLSWSDCTPRHTPAMVSNLDGSMDGSTSPSQ